MFACIYVPDFPVEAIVRSEPLLREHAVAVLEGKPPLARVIALNEKARGLGIGTGMTKLQAAVFCEERSNNDVSQGRGTRKLNSPGSGVLRQRSPEQEKAAHAALLDVAHAFSPRVEDSAPDVLLMDLSGLERLYGGPAKMGRDLKSRVTAVGIEANIALAANPDAAMHAARGFQGITVIPAGSEVQRLGVLPVQILLDALAISSPKLANQESSAREREKLREQRLDTLEGWGVRDFRTLALLPEHALTSRLGQIGAQLRRLARGEGMRTLALCAPQSQFEEAMELECPVETIEPLAFVLNRLLQQLCARLEARALAAQELRLRLQLEHRVGDEQTTTIQELNGATSFSDNVGAKPMMERLLRLPVAMRDSKVFLKLLQLDLAAHPPGAPIIKLWIAAQPAPPRSAQRGLFLPITPEPEKLEITLARINAIVGERRAGIARGLDSHRRDSFQITRFIAGDEISNPLTMTLPDTRQRVIALRLIRPARRLKVNLSEGRPTTLAFESEVLWGKVMWSAGPWRSSGDWWTENSKENLPTGPWDREEWDIAIAMPRNDASEEQAPLTLYRIYRDTDTSEWFADACYD
ncbi:MAG TPA: DNA polymerase Y family protein [Alloacidobacterium sp.]|nr:DNA polymerase Y family protein [Alloacidobacterium sp.]